MSQENKKPSQTPQTPQTQTPFMVTVTPGVSFNGIREPGDSGSVVVKGPNGERIGAISR